MKDSTRRFFIVLFFVIGVTLLFLVGHNMVSIYRGTIGGVEQNESRTMACQQISFNVEFADEDTLLISNSMMSSFNIDAVTILDYETQDSFSEEFFVFSPGSERELDISDISGDFLIYPLDCHHMAKICSPDMNECDEYGA